MNGGEDEQGALGGNQASDVLDGLPSGWVRKGLHRDDLDHQVKGVPPGCRQGEQLGHLVVDHGVRDALTGESDRGDTLLRRDVGPLPRDRICEEPEADMEGVGSCLLQRIQHGWTQRFTRISAGGCGCGSRNGRS
ncbi:MAG TPA: hypothetical protein VNB91_02510 [Jatrophihabitantaceae bacterium]|nr:hypothetical protein [Jatrophihabitantaceae bacterium]